MSECKFNMPVIYLDFDGVLNIESGLFNKNCISNLNRIVENIQCSIVISSSWRYSFSLDRLKLELLNNGFNHPERIVDVTPNLEIVNPETDIVDDFPCRGLEILSHVRVNKIKKWIAIDDCCDGYMKYNLIQTTYKDGLTEQLAYKAIKMLKDETIREIYKQFKTGE